MPIAPSPYDAIAGLYQKGWRNWYWPAAADTFTQLFFPFIPAGCKVLDLCCGCGHVSRELVRLGYQVTGLDLSSGLIEQARQEVACPFLVGDARSFTLAEPQAAVVSTFDSLNHLLTYDDLLAALRSVYATLLPEGVFFFDMNLEDAYLLDLGRWTVQDDAETVGLVRGAYDPLRKRACTELMWFIPEPVGGLWRRETSVVEEQCYSIEEITQALDEAGFRVIEHWSADEAGMTSELGYGRCFFRAIR